MRCGWPATPARPLPAPGCATTRALARALPGLPAAARQHRRRPRPTAEDCRGRRGDRQQSPACSPGPPAAAAFNGLGGQHRPAQPAPVRRRRRAATTLQPPRQWPTCLDCTAQPQRGSWSSANRAAAARHDARRPGHARNSASLFASLWQQRVERILCQPDDYPGLLSFA